MVLLVPQMVMRSLALISILPASPLLKAVVRICLPLVTSTPLALIAMLPPLVVLRLLAFKIPPFDTPKLPVVTLILPP